MKYENIILTFSLLLYMSLQLVIEIPRKGHIFNKKITII